MSWSSEELKYADLGDKRRDRRLIKIVEDLVDRPSMSIPQASRDTASMSGAYDFFANRRIDSDAIVAAHSSSTVKRCQSYETVLVLQDTTDLDFSHHRKKKGVGPISKEKALGLRVHSALCVSSGGVPLGLLHQEVWARDRNKRGSLSAAGKRQIAEKESYRWLSTLESTQQLLPDSIRMVTVSDREGDIYELFCVPRRPGSEFLIRAKHNRTVTVPGDLSSEPVKLWDLLRGSPLQGEHSIELQRTPRRRPRRATLSLRYREIEVHPPADHPDKARLPSLRLTALLAEEEHPPEGSTAISWLLLSTMVIGSLPEAIETLTTYTFRWRIERYHFILKSGCRIEELQLESGDRIERALATYAIVAWRLLWLTYESRVQPDSPVSVVLEPHEWQALYSFIHKGSRPPSEAPSLKESVLWLAKLGGFLGRKSDGPPGVVTIWRGLQRLHDIAIAWQLFSYQPP